MSALPLLLEPAELEPRLDDQHLLIVDMRSPESYARGHLPGAVRLDYAALVQARPPVGGLLADPAQLAAAFGAIGLSPQHHVVAYDDEGCGKASRLLWTLDALGHAGRSLLNGGLISWHQEGRPLAQSSTSTPGTSYPASFANPDAVAERDYILSRLNDADFIALDTRSAAEYRGEDLRAARGGHIPGAVNFNWTDAIDPDNATRLRPADELRDRLADLGVTPDKEVVTYCQTHHRSSHTYVVLKHLQFPRVRGYHGAWSDWGNDPAAPIEA